VAASKKQKNDTRAHDDIQVGEAAGINDPSNIPWRMTAWRAGPGDGNYNAVEKGTVAEGNLSGIGVPLTPDEKKAKKRLQDKIRRSPTRKNTLPSRTIFDNRGRSARHLATLSKL